MRRTISRRTKNICSLALTACLALPATALALCGDIDNQRGVNATDALLALRATVGLGAVAVETGDVNADGNVTLHDALLILRHATSGAPPLKCPVAVLFYIANESRVSAISMRIADIGFVRRYDRRLESEVLECYDRFGNVGFTEYDCDESEVVYAAVNDTPRTGPFSFMRCLVYPDWSFSEEDIAELEALVYESGDEAPEPPDVWPEIAAVLE